MRYLSLVLVVVLSLSSFAQEGWAPFPSDPPQVQLVDRASHVVWHGDTSVTFYAVLYKQGGKSYLDVYKGLPWARIHSWDIEFEGQSVDVPDNSVLEIGEYEDQIFFHWDEFVGYREAAVNLSLTYHRNTGKFSTSWSD